MKKKLFFITIFALLIGYFAVNYFIGSTSLKSIRNLFSHQQKYTIKKYIFPYKLISQQEEYISHLQELTSKLNWLEVELDFKKNLDDITLIKREDFKLSNNKTMIRYEFLHGFYTGIVGKIPGGYMDFHQDNLFVLSSRGVLGYSDNFDLKNNVNDEIYFKQIKNNINDFIGFDQFQKSKTLSAFSLKDIYIDKDKIYVSYTEEIKENCWNTSIIHGNINYENIIFEKLFSSKDCIITKGSNQNGGRIVNFDENHILLSVGDYRNRALPQDKKSINGKIIKINISNSNYEIVSMGHRNPQGLYFDKKDNLILVTEHGPYGGDEINLIETNKINKDDPLNYGWAVVSAGEHYCSVNSKTEEQKEKCSEIYEEFPLYKSHTDHGFIEPLKSFVPSIAISEITRIGEKKYVIGAMGQGKRIGDQSLYFFELDNEKKITNLEKVRVFKRVRDLIYKNNKLYVFLERPSAIGIISFD